MKKFLINEINKEENYISLRLNSNIYSKENIFAAGYVFLDRAYIILDKDNQDILVYLIPQKKEDDLKKLGLDFANELLNYAHYFANAKANAEVIKTIMQRALVSAAPSIAKEAEDKELEELIKELESEEKASKK